MGIQIGGAWLILTTAKARTPDLGQAIGLCPPASPSWAKSRPPCQQRTHLSPLPAV